MNIQISEYTNWLQYFLHEQDFLDDSGKLLQQDQEKNNY